MRHILLAAVCAASAYAATPDVGGNGAAAEEITGHWEPKMPPEIVMHADPKMPKRVQKDNVSIDVSAESPPIGGNLSAKVDFSTNGSSKGEKNEHAHASRHERYIWVWVPSSAPIQNKDVAVSISGSANLYLVASVTDISIRDFSRASATISENGHGIVGHRDNVDGLLSSVNEGPVALSASIISVTDTNDILVGFSASGSSTSQGGSGSYSLGGGVSGLFSSSNINSIKVDGTANSTASWAITVSASDQANTDNVPQYETMLDQQVDVTGSVGSSERFYKNNNSVSHADASAEFFISPRIP